MGWGKRWMCLGMILGFLVFLIVWGGYGIGGDYEVCFVYDYSYWEWSVYVEDDSDIKMVVVENV